MLSSFFPADRLESYRTSPYKSRLDRIGQRLVEQRYHPEVLRSICGSGCA